MLATGLSYATWRNMGSHPTWPVTALCGGPGKKVNWIQHHGIFVQETLANVFALSSDLHMWQRCCLQGTFCGQQVVVAAVSANGPTVYLEFDRTLGWRAHPGSIASPCMELLLEDVWATGWVRATTFHQHSIIEFFFFNVQEDGDELLSFLFSELPLHF